jgi:serine/threonine protein kinase, bacterial
MSQTLLSNRYRIVEELVEGGFSQTFLANDLLLPSQRRCIVKKLKPIASNLQVVHSVIKSRFDVEASTLEALGNKSEQIPDLYAYFEEDGKFYIIQQFIEGQTLTERVHMAGPLDEGKVKDILCSLLNLLHYIHSKNVIHRDLKPANIILRQPDDKPVLIDFGAVKEVMGTVLSSQEKVEQSVAIGTPGFMPNEQAAGRPIFSSDLYSLGLTMIYLLTGKQPGTWPEDLETDIQTGEVIWRHDAPQVSVPFANILDKVIQPQPRDRYATATEMLSAVQTLTTSALPTTGCRPTLEVDTPLKRSVTLDRLTEVSTKLRNVPQLFQRSGVVSKLASLKNQITIGIGAIALRLVDGVFALVSKVYYGFGLLEWKRGDRKAAIAHFKARRIVKC